MDIFKADRAYSFADYRDAQNNAALGDWKAIRAVENLRIELLVRKLTR